MAANIILYGCGNVGKEALEFFREGAVAYFCDSRADLAGKQKYGKEIIPLSRLEKIHRDHILIVCTIISTADEIVDMLCEKGIEDFLVYKAIPQTVFEKMSATDFLREYSAPEKRQGLLCEYYKDRTKRLKYQLTYLKKHADITTLKPAVGKLRERQMELIDFANDFFAFISELNIKPFLISGGLIGAVRHKGFVPWDDDLDFGLMREDYNRLIEFCKKNCVVYMYEGMWEDWRSPDVPKEDYPRLFEEHENEWILGITVDEIWIAKGNASKQYEISFWAHDFYCDDYSLEEHNRYLQYIKEKQLEIGKLPAIMEFLQKEIAENKNISKVPTGKIQPGLDNGIWHTVLGKGRGWIRTEDVLPLVKCPFEQTTFFVPHNPERFLEYEYPDYMEFPNDLGIQRHMEM